MSSLLSQANFQCVLLVGEASTQSISRSESQPRSSTQRLASGSVLGTRHRIGTWKSGRQDQALAGTLNRSPGDREGSASAEAFPDLLSDGASHRRRKCIADLAVRGGLAPGELPLIGKALQPRYHTDCQPRHSHKLGVRSGIPYSLPIYSQRSPGFSGASRSEVGPAMLAGTSHDRGCYLICLLPPSLCSLPPVRTDQVKKYFGYRGRHHESTQRPSKATVKLLFDRDEQDPRAKLRDTEVGCIEAPPVGPIS